MLPQWWRGAAAGSLPVFEAAVPLFLGWIRLVLIDQFRRDFERIQLLHVSSSASTPPQGSQEAGIVSLGTGLRGCDCASLCAFMVSSRESTSFFVCFLGVTRAVAPLRGCTLSLHEFTSLYVGLRRLYVV